MKSDYVLIGSVLLLAIGLGLIFGYTHGTVGFSAAYPVSGASLQVSLNTTGLPAMAGVPLTLLGLLLLIAAAIIATVRTLPGSGRQGDHS
ncbi:MAG: hypothetical protein ACLPLR_19080 [Terriglobales bacterium]